MLFSSKMQLFVKQLSGLKITERGLKIMINT